MKLTKIRDGRRGLSPLGGLLVAYSFTLVIGIVIGWTMFS